MSQPSQSQPPQGSQEEEQEEDARSVGPILVNKLEVQRVHSVPNFRMNQVV